MSTKKDHHFRVVQEILEFNRLPLGKPSNVVMEKEIIILGFNFG